MGLRTASSVKRIDRSSLLTLSLAVALLAAACWWFAAASRVTEEGASRQLAVAADAVAAAFDAPLSRFAQLTSGFRPSDFAASDRLAMTARQIRLQGAIPYASATFLATASGRVVAASAPFPSNEAEVGQSAWFQHALAQTGGGLALQRVDAAWLRAGSTVLVTRTILDEAEHPVGVVGAIFGLDDLRSLLRPAWIPDSVTTRLVTSDGTAILQAEAASEPTPTDVQGLAAWLPRVLLALDRLAGRPTTLSAVAQVRPIRFTVQASLPSEVVIRTAWKDPSEAALGFVLIAGAVACLLLAAFPARRREREVSHAAVYGADWGFELDSQGVLTSSVCIACSTRADLL